MQALMNAAARNYGLLTIALAVVSGCADDSVTKAAASEDPAPDTSISAQWIDGPNPGSSCNASPKPSTNCGDPLAPGDERTCKIGDRSYIIHAGKTYDPCKPAALVVDVPSAIETAKQQIGGEPFCLGLTCWNGLGSGWMAESDTESGGFIVVVPERNNATRAVIQELGDLTGINAFTDATGLSSANSATSPDANFIRQVVASVKQSVDIDPARVYISGFSDGGDLAWALGCQNPETFRGVAPNGSGFPCSRLNRSTPFITFTSKGDYEYDSAVSASETAARLNGCKRGPSSWRSFNNRTPDAVCRSNKSDPKGALVPCSSVTSARIEPTACKVWDQCNGGVEVVLCEVAPDTQHGPLNASADAHVVYYNNTLLNNASVAWRFFSQFHD